MKKNEKEILKYLINNESINRLYSFFILLSLSMDKSVKLRWINLEDNLIIIKIEKMINGIE